MFCGIGNPYIVASSMFHIWLKLGDNVDGASSDAFDADHHNDDDADTYADNAQLVS